MKRLWVLAALCPLLSLAQAQQPVRPPAQKAPPSPAAEWYRAGHVTLTLADPARDFRAAWQFDRADNGDHRVLRDESLGGKTLKGSVMSVCQDQALVMQGITPDRGWMIRY